MFEAIRKSFTPTHHALLFGWISRGVIRVVGEDRGEVIMRKAVRHYAAQRGRRMAMRAQRDEQELNMLNYLVYGEWESGETEMHVWETLQSDPHFAMRISICPWMTAWRENNLIPYGRYYCMEVDEALVRSFNSELRLDVNKTLPDSGECCDFIFHDAELTPENNQVMAERIQELNGSAIMPWDYHIGHLYWSISEVIEGELGEHSAVILNEALENFTQRFGEEAAQIVLEYQQVDFNSLLEAQEETN